MFRLLSIYSQELWWFSLVAPPAAAGWWAEPELLAGCAGGAHLPLAHRHFAPFLLLRHHSRPLHPRMGGRRRKCQEGFPAVRQGKNPPVQCIVTVFFMIGFLPTVFILSLVTPPTSSAPFTFPTPASGGPSPQMPRRLFSSPTRQSPAGPIHRNGFLYD